MAIALGGLGKWLRSPVEATRQRTHTPEWQGAA